MVFVLLLVLAEVFLFQPCRLVAVDSLETLFVFLLYFCLTIAGRPIAVSLLLGDPSFYCWLNFHWILRGCHGDFIGRFVSWTNSLLLRADILCLRLLHYANVVLCGIFECSYLSTGLLLLSTFWPDFSLDPVSAWCFPRSSGLALWLVLHSLNCFNIGSRFLELVSFSTTCLDLLNCLSYAVSLISREREGIPRFSLEAYGVFHSDSSRFIGSGNISLPGFCSSTLLIREAVQFQKWREFSHRLFRGKTSLMTIFVWTPCLLIVPIAGCADM